MRSQRGSKKAESAEDVKPAAGAAPEEIRAKVQALTPEQLQEFVITSVVTGKLTLADVIAASGTKDGRPESRLPAELQKRISANSEANMANNFAIFDEKGSGFISLDQYIKVLTRPTPDQEPLCEEDAIVMFADLDKDQDGFVNYHDFALDWADALEAERAAQKAANDQARLDKLMVKA